MTESPPEVDLRAAARADDPAGVINAIRQGTPVDEPDEHGRTAPHLAVISGHDQVVMLLLDAGADPNTADATGFTVLMEAASFSRPGVVQLLVDAGADVNVIGPDGRTALLDSVWTETSTTEVVEILLRAGADPSQADRNCGLAPRDWAAEKGDAAVVQLFDTFRSATEP